ncbi:unnamed protein product [Ceutorhynchus assimilis]|uniref:Tetraspanin n=1 Tax=Ceutorhynchus assimilis TaxID=467358 RepID=A0A9N9QLR8_9CUCU|nr:unnamed protein product [Ceutorhynchus assimilis]
MNLSCSSKMIKYLMFGFNLFFVISGIIIIAVGAAVKTVYTEYSQFLDGKYFSLPNMLIATGALIFMISFFGCCGALKESWIMLGIFSILLFIIFVFEFASGIAGYVLKGKTADYLDSTLRANLLVYNQTHDVWDLIQTTFQCCGVDNYHDWQGHLNGTYDLPLSCCPTVSGVTAAFYCNSRNDTTISTTTSVLSTTSTDSSTATTTVSSTTTTTLATTPTTKNTSETSESTPTSPTTPSSTTPKLEPSSSDPNVRRKRALIDENSTPHPSTSPPYAAGCKAAFGDYVKKHAVQIGGCALGLAVVQILGIAFSCHLVRQLKNGYYST